MFEKNIKFYRGVTFMELMVVIAIIGIMSAVGFSMWQSSKRDSYMRNAQREVASAIKTAQSYALQGRVQNGSVPCSYGVSFSGSTDYNIYYADCSGSSGSVESFKLNNGITTDGTTFNVYFTIPFGVKDGDSSIALKYGTSITKTLNISEGGSVTEQ